MFLQSFYVRDRIAVMNVRQVHSMLVFLIFRLICSSSKTFCCCCFIRVVSFLEVHVQSRLLFSRNALHFYPMTRSSENASERKDLRTGSFDLGSSMFTCMAMNGSLNTKFASFDK